MADVAGPTAATTSTASTAYTAPIAVVWFKRDLRISDHTPLYDALQTGLPVLPVFIFEPALMRQPDSAARHYGFVLEALRELSDALKAMGLRLHTPIMESLDFFRQIASQYGQFQLFSHEETGNLWTFRRDIAVRQWCKGHQIVWREYRQNGVIRRLKSRDGWAQKWDQFMALPCTQSQKEKGYSPPDFDYAPLPALFDLKLMDQDCNDRQKGSRSQGESLLESFLYERGKPYRRHMSSPITAAHSCSLLSPYLAWGLLSTREVAQKTWTRLRQLKTLPLADRRGWQGSITAFSGRLHWRCHFMQKLEDEPELETRPMHPLYEGLRPRQGDPALVQAWATGTTGYPFVDACMRYLHRTGWINFRMRAMLMSIASYHLWLDWRETGPILARTFVDYEPGIHWPQVQMQSGTTGINAIRLYNPLKQGHTQDPDGAFIRSLVPELSHVPDAFIHEPWQWPGFDKQGYGMRVFDHVQAARLARDKVWAVRKSAEFKATSEDIVTRHASRRDRHKLEGKRRSPRSHQKNKAADQLSLFEEADNGENA